MWKSSARYDYLLFVLSRLVGVAARPLVLLLAFNTDQADFATEYALVMTAVTSSYVIYANQNHRALYNLFLDQSSPRKGVAGKDATLAYLDGVAIHMVAFTPVVIILVWGWVEVALLFVLTMPMVMIEKYYDDHQRALIYKKAYRQWSLHFLFRLILPNVLLLLALTFVSGTGIEIYVALVVICFIVYFCTFDLSFASVLKQWIRRLLNQTRVAITKRIKTYFENYVTDYLGAQVFTILAINLLLIDRFFVKAGFGGLFAQYIFAINIISMISVFHNIFHFTRIRSRLISQSYPVFSTVLSLRNIGIPLLLACGALVSFPVMEFLGLLDQVLDWAVLLGLAVVHVVSAISLTLNEFCFWRVRRHWLVLMDVLILSLIFAVLTVFEHSLVWIPYVLASGLTGRALIQGWLCSTNINAVRLPLPSKEPII